MKTEITMEEDTSAAILRIVSRCSLIWFLAVAVVILNEGFAAHGAAPHTTELDLSAGAEVNL